MKSEGTAALAPRPDEASQKLRVLVYPRTAWPRVAPTWAELAKTSSGTTVFLTPEWVEAWIDVFGPRVETRIVLFENSEETVGACLLTWTRTGLPFLKLRRVSLNCTGEDQADTTYLEFNRLLCRLGWERAVAKTLADFLASQDWEEFALDGFIPDAGYEAMKQAFHKCELDETRHPSYYSDLESIRRNGTPYEMLLGRTTRKHLRQHERAYSARGTVRLECAGTADEALAMFAELSALNRAHREGRGLKSVFRSSLFQTFHRELIRRCFDAGSVQLLRVAVGTETVGLVYNLVHRGKVYFYQCGFNYGAGPHLSPGTVTISRAIRHCMDLGLDDFDFLSGESAYKRTLSTGSRQLVWAVFRRRSRRARIGGALQRCRRWLADRLKRES